LSGDYQTIQVPVIGTMWVC